MKTSRVFYPLYRSGEAEPLLEKLLLAANLWSRARVIKKIVPKVKPWRIASCKDAYATIELAAGEASRLNLCVGDTLHWSCYEQN